MESRRFIRASLVALALAAPAAAQPNVVPGLDLALENVSSLNDYVRSGAFPNGASAWGMGSTCCNPGTVAVPFQAAMDPDHGFIHFLLVRESGGRMVQISDWSSVKHTFGSNNFNSTCGTCVPTVFSEVSVGCNDSYASSQAVDHYNLGPPSEIDPWTGIWNPVCSTFDMGDPPVAPAQQCDGVRSLTASQASALNAGLNRQVRVHDQDLIVAGTYYFQCGYIVPGEAEANRANNIGSRPFTANWNGSQYLVTSGTPFLQGSVLQRWSGSTLSSAANGASDGRLYVAVRVTGPTNGLYHYEYAVHNRDNDRGVGAFRVPICPGTQVSNFGFHDVDQNAGNEWTAAVVGSEVVFSTAGNPLRWNSIFNFWFDADAAPVTGSSLALDQFDAGPGAASVAVTSTAPLGLFNESLGAGCGAPAPTLFGTGSPARAAIPNASFGLTTTGNPALAPVGLLLSFATGSLPLGGGCTLYSASLPTMIQIAGGVCDAAGTKTFPAPIPNDPSLEGASADVQVFTFVPGGPYLGNFAFTNGLRVRLGNAIPTCP